jgi:hypothetical protein
MDSFYSLILKLKFYGYATLNTDFLNSLDA